MSYNLNIPKLNNKSLDISVNIGECLFILGANGTGKSSLMHKFYCGYRDNSHRITAHRQTWLPSNSLTLSPNEKKNTETNIHNSDSNPQARWKDDYSASRANIAIYDLINSENKRARKIANAVDSKDISLAERLSQNDSPIIMINELLRLSNINIEISIKDNEEIVASKLGGKPFSIAELSDGERNALLIASSVLTVPEGTLLLIDEPERHLHRSIISPLLTLLFEKRNDCAFIISTHDVMLPLDNETSSTLLIRDCTYNESSVVSWDADILLPEDEIDELLKKDILGSRRKLLFIEGNESSLDKPLYSLIFPNVSVIPKSSCRDVDHAVSGIRNAEKLHWLHPFGIIDNDRREQNDIEKLKNKKIYSVSVYSVESIYYHPKIQKFIAERQVAVIEDNVADLIDEANKSIISTITEHKERMAKRAIEKLIQHEFDEHRPKQSDITNQIFNVSIDIPYHLNNELGILQGYIDTNDIESIISKYPIRETQALNKIASSLKFINKKSYESAVRKLLMENNDALLFIRGLFDTLYNDITVD